VSIDKPTYASGGGRTFRFPSMEEVIRASTDKELDMIIYADGILECSIPAEMEIALDEERKRQG
jgi:hypothetical protein